MCFGKKLSQDEPGDCMSPFPTPNNFCGGFALNAVLTEISPELINPMAVYYKIQEYQNTKVLPGCKTYDFLHNPAYIQNGTLMSLPSGICAAFRSYPTGKTVTVYYTEAFKSIPQFSGLIEEERGRIAESGTVNPDCDLPETGWNYVLILVHGRHWIAVKHIEEEKFTCYDPASGEAKTGNNIKNALLSSKYKLEDISGLYICIS